MAYDIDYAAVGRRIRARRKEIGFSSGSAAAEEFGYTQCKWSNMENGKYITVANILDLSKRCLLVPTEWLLFGEEFKKGYRVKSVQDALSDAEDARTRAEYFRQQEAEAKEAFAEFVKDKFGIEGGEGLISFNIIEADSSEGIEAYIGHLNRI